MFFSINLQKSWLSDDQPYVITEMATQLVLAAECAGPHTQRWLEKGLFHGSNPGYTVQFTEDEFKTLQDALQRASAAIRANVCISNFTLPLFCNLKTPM
jgi:hypothetical protein